MPPLTSQLDVKTRTKLRMLGFFCWVLDITLEGALFIFIGFVINPLIVIFAGMLFWKSLKVAGFFEGKKKYWFVGCFLTSLLSLGMIPTWIVFHRALSGMVKLDSIKDKALGKTQGKTNSSASKKENENTQNNQQPR